MRVLRPRYRLGAREVDSPFGIEGSVPAVDLAALAFLFTGPGLYGEFAPSSYWNGVSLVWPPPTASTRDLTLEAAFACAVAEMCAGADTVGVKLSGGMDSLAVLLQVAALQPARRVVAYCTEMTDDQGTSTLSVARRLLDQVGVESQLVAIDPSVCTATPAWSPCGPRLDARPSVNTAVAEMAADNGVDVLLSGDGADELLGMPRYASGTIAKVAGPSAACRYLRDIGRSGPGLLGELVAATADRLPPMTGAQLYWAANWPSWCSPSISEVVPPGRLRDQAIAVASDWVDAAVADHAEAARHWAAADAFDSFWPQSFTPAAIDALPEGSPFLHEDFVAAALALPLASRYDAHLPTAYQRCKAAVVRLLPTHARAVLPARKQYFEQALKDAVAGPIEIPAAAAVGLLDPNRLAQEPGTAVRMNALAVEAWLAGAVARGIVVHGSA